MHHDCIDRVLDLVSDACREAADCSEAAGKLDFVLDATDRFGVAHGQKRANALSALGDKIQRDLDAAAVLQFNFTLWDRLVQSEGVEHNTSQFVGIAENAFHQVAKDLSSRPADEALGRSA